MGNQPDRGRRPFLAGLIADSPDLQRKLRAARALQISLREFDGWTPREVTEVTGWDEQGRPKGWTTRRESPWNSRERGWMLALDWHEGGLCRKCGHSLAETTDPNNDPDNPRAPRMYVAEQPVECLHCKVLAKSEQKWSKQDPDQAPYLIHTAVLVDRPARRRKGGSGG